MSKIISVKTAYTRHLLHKEIKKLADKYSTKSTYSSIWRILYRFLPITDMYKDKWDMIKTLIYTSIRINELIVNENDIKKLTDDYQKIIKNELELGKNIKDQKFTIIHETNSVIFTYNDTEFKISNCFKSKFFVNFNVVDLFA